MHVGLTTSGIKCLSFWSSQIRLYFLYDLRKSEFSNFPNTALYGWANLVSHPSLLVMCLFSLAHLNKLPSRLKKDMRLFEDPTNVKNQNNINKKLYKLLYVISISTGDLCRSNNLEYLIRTIFEADFLP